MHSKTSGEQPWWTYGVWVVAAGALGWFVSALFSSVLRLSRNWFLLPYVGIIGAFIYNYVRWSGIDIGAHSRHRWVSGIVGAFVLSVVMVLGVVQQPASSQPHGVELVFALVWVGAVYGALDALLLTVMPVLASHHMCKRLGIHHQWSGKGIRAVVALVASLLVTTAYHWGYVEFRGPQVIQPIIGNALITLGYLLTTNPTTPVVAHSAMHIAAVLHGMETTVQLPPHY
jgi:hypothetical protein